MVSKNSSVHIILGYPPELSGKTSLLDKIHHILVTGKKEIKVVFTWKHSFCWKLLWFLEVLYRLLKKSHQILSGCKTWERQ